MAQVLLSCGHALNLDLPGRKPGECPQGCRSSFVPIDPVFKTKDEPPKEHSPDYRYKSRRKY